MAISFQVVLVVGHADVVAPQNLSAAVAYNCIRCVTEALAVQLVVTLPGPVSGPAMQRLMQLWQQIRAFGRHLRGLTFAQIRSRLADYERQILAIVRPDLTKPSPTPSPSGSAAPTATAGPSATAAPTASASDTIPGGSPAATSSVSGSPAGTTSTGDSTTGSTAPTPTPTPTPTDTAAATAGSSPSSSPTSTETQSPSTTSSTSP